MNSTLDKEDNFLKHKIQHYSKSKLFINNTTYTSSIILNENTDIIPWNISNSPDITIAIIKKIPKADILIIGTGITHSIIDLKIIAQSKISIEYMKTSAACSTYTLLAQEGRSVVAALIV